MNVSLTPELEQMVNEKVQTGMYQTASEVIRAGLRLLRERDQHVESLRRDVRAGLAAVEDGDYTDYARSEIASSPRMSKRGGGGGRQKNIDEAHPSFRTYIARRFGSVETANGVNRHVIA